MESNGWGSYCCLQQVVGAASVGVDRNVIACLLTDENLTASCEVSDNTVTIK